MGNDPNNNPAVADIIDDEDYGESFNWLFGDLDENEPVSFEEPHLESDIIPSESTINLPTLYTLEKNQVGKVISIKFNSKTLAEFLQKCNSSILEPQDQETKNLKTEYVKELDDHFKDNNQNIVLSLYIKLQPEQQLKKLGEIYLKEKPQHETIGEFILRKTAELFKSYKNEMDKIMAKKVENANRLEQIKKQQNQIASLQQHADNLENSAGRGY
ncbi:hypothetical protein P344_03235 [Spiroplasma mirum ATCC 29335]|uniref:Uncharacterized protein n=1 Tax=Spiroplasma mirum ATCC 29335 TaxID=838561 RepID=W0GL37_9MOLU|nr:MULTISPECIES: hypothetical protein [Spiroplasma]AHF60975.1 hypothetical protein SMM_0548 [Spiroplasma mirum ATCC 29335]AHI57991.1 hypothetical protein P344_03235 [Spiroplasma mirum ATCC 29335]AKM53077.1 hypothetical protein SATRI_v1c06030 [Spiroplasma atrichopogonis]